MKHCPKCGETKPAEIVVLIVIAVPAAVVLNKFEREPHAICGSERFFEREYGLAGNIAAAGTNFGRPGRFVVAVVGVFDGTSHAALAAFVIEDLP